SVDYGRKAVAVHLEVLRERLSVVPAERQIQLARQIWQVSIHECRVDNLCIGLHDILVPSRVRENKNWPTCRSTSQARAYHMLALVKVDLGAPDSVRQHLKVSRAWVTPLARTTESADLVACEFQYAVC